MEYWHASCVCHTMYVHVQCYQLQGKGEKVCALTLSHVRLVYQARPFFARRVERVGKGRRAKKGLA